jgi:RHS repeat-associated protein
LNDRKAPANPIKFAGEYLDATGLYHLRARQYDPSTGRFSTTDPKPTTPTQPYMSAYIYANDNPTALTDPSGMGAIGDSCGSLWCWADHTFTGNCITGIVIGGGLAIASEGALTPEAAYAAGKGCAGGVGSQGVGEIFGDHAKTAVDLTLNGKEVIDRSAELADRLARSR